MKQSDIEKVARDWQCQDRLTMLAGPDGFVAGAKWAFVYVKAEMEKNMMMDLDTQACEWIEKTCTVHD